MKTTDEIIYDAITADTAIMTATAGRVVSTCFEVPPDTLDNTPTPNIIVTFDGFTNQTLTKDTVWEGDEDRVQVGVDIAADSPEGVRQLVRLVRKAIEEHIVALYGSGEQTPMLEALSSDGIQWDWIKPCYFQRLTYQCLTPADNEEDN